jgi:predicted nucleic acid-binding protein
MGEYFADAFYWVALAQATDAWHTRALHWQQTHPHARFVTTEEVLTEVLNWFSGFGPAGRSHAVYTVRSILADVQVTVLPQTHADFVAALALYDARSDKGYSHTDCRSMLAMKGRGIGEVLTNDHHFAQEGLTILFP